jgi:hypothetical protein
VTIASIRRLVSGSSSQSQSRVPTSWRRTGHAAPRTSTIRECAIPVAGLHDTYTLQPHQSMTVWDMSIIMRETHDGRVSDG